MTEIQPLFAPKAYDEHSVFHVENLLREARRQRALTDTPVPRVCLLDPDGDTVRTLRANGRATRDPNWACYHSELWRTTIGEHALGIVPCAVGAPYAVLVAEELIASGCEIIISVTSAGRIIPLGEPPYFILIERAWRDEGTSLHYAPPAEWATLRRDLRQKLDDAFIGLNEPVYTGRSWTTDAPFRETASAIAAAESAGVHAVEMEAAALYAFSETKAATVVCIAHVTNTMAVDGDDFDKGDSLGTHRILAVAHAITNALSTRADQRSAPASVHGTAPSGSVERLGLS
jgi:uridine phosphorylase